MSKQAIQQDAETGAQGTPNQNRMSAMESISRNRVQSLAEDNEIDPSTFAYEGAPEGYDDHPTHQGGESDGSEEGEQSVVEEGESSAGDKGDQSAGKDGGDSDDSINKSEAEIISLSSDDENRYIVRVKIDGEEQELPLSQLKRGYQKDSAASKRLEEAARRQRELDEREELLRQREEAAQSNNQTAASVESGDEGEDTPPVSTADETVKTFLDAFYGGNEEEAAEALTQLLQSSGRQTTETTRTQEVDTSTIVNEVKSTLEFESARDHFKANYEDVWSDPNLASMADRIYAEEIESGATYKEAFSNAGNRVREWVTSVAVAKAGDTGASSRKDKKRGLDNLEGNGDTSTGKSQEQAPKGPSDVINEMAAARGSHRRY